MPGPLLKVCNESRAARLFAKASTITVGPRFCTQRRPWATLSLQQVTLPGRSVSAGGGNQYWGPGVAPQSSVLGFVDSHQQKYYNRMPIPGTPSDVWHKCLLMFPGLCSSAYVSVREDGHKRIPPTQSLFRTGVVFLLQTAQNKGLDCLDHPQQSIQYAGQERYHLRELRCVILPSSKNA